MKKVSQPVIIWIITGIVLALLLAAALTFRNTSARPEQSKTTQVISESTLEEEYGIRVNLVAVTAGGGFLDVRLKILNADKAARLLRDQKDYPSLQVGKNGPHLQVPAENQQDLTKLENGSMIFIMAPNLRNAVKPITPITILIGDKKLEPITAQ